MPRQSFQNLYMFDALFTIQRVGRPKKCVGIDPSWELRRDGEYLASLVWSQIFATQIELGIPPLKIVLPGLSYPLEVRQCWWRTLGQWCQMPLPP